MSYEIETNVQAPKSAVHTKFPLEALQLPDAEGKQNCLFVPVTGATAEIIKTEQKRVAANVRQSALRYGKQNNMKFKVAAATRTKEDVTESGVRCWRIA